MFRVNMKIFYSKTIKYFGSTKKNKYTVRSDYNTRRFRVRFSISVKVFCTFKVCFSQCTEKLLKNSRNYLLKV